MLGVPSRLNNNLSGAQQVYNKPIAKIKIKQ